MMSLTTIIAIPSLMFLGFILFMYHYMHAQYLPFLIHMVKLSALYFGLSFIVNMSVDHLGADANRKVDHPENPFLYAGS